MAGYPLITISIVSHAQGDLVRNLLSDLSGFINPGDVEVILTKNVPERMLFIADHFPYSVKIVENDFPKGFGANHNAAFRIARGDWFCVMNPDIRMPENPLPILLEEMEQRQAAVTAPAVLSPAGQIEDSIRRFPTPFSLGGKMLGWSDGRYRFAVGDETFAVEWVGGMFMLFRAEDYRAIGGFNEDFFLYYEDVDICTRFWKSGRPVLACPKTQVIHDARRTSRRDLRYFRWHITSMARYFWKHWGLLPKGKFS